LTQQHRYAEVDALRGIAALSVLIYHVVGHRVSIVFGAAEQPRGIFDPLTIDAVVSAIVTTIFDGSAAVVLFFVISGFVLAASLERTPRPTPATYLGFMLRRLFRLMPAVWFSLGVMIAILCYYNAMPPLWTMINAFWLGDGFSRSTSRSGASGSSLPSARCFRCCSLPIGWAAATVRSPLRSC
jgi:peptidoglycan/LPS O-acetylase OafA/YrhL